MADAQLEKIHAASAQFLAMPTGGVLVIHSVENREIQVVLTTPVVEELSRQLFQRDTPPSRNG
jgi:hypothetical protein